MSLANLIKRLQDIMRKDSGVDGDAQRLAQIVWLIFLKVYDYKEEEAELEDDYTPVIPEGYRWRDWAIGESVKDQLTGPDLLDFVNNELIPVLGGNAITDEKGNQVIPFDKTDAKSLLVKEFMSDAVNYMKNGYLLRDVVNLFDEVNLEDSGEAHEFNDMYEGLLKGLQSAGTMGEFYTNRAITSFAIDHLDPQLGGCLADWAAGTGGFLISALEHMQRQVKPGDTESQRKLQSSIRGGELKPMAYKLNVTNLLLHGIELPNIRYGDSLSEKNLNEFKGNDLVEYCALNPPYGGVSLPEDIQSFPADLRSSETADLFVALSVKRLKDGGKGVIVLPDGFLFGNDNAKIAIKKYLMKECNLHTIIRLPQSCFAPYTSIATNLLFFDKGESTEEIWFYRLDMPKGYKHFSKTKPMKREHFNCVDEWWNDRKEIVDEKEHEDMTTTYKAKKYTIEEIVENEYNIDLCGYPTEEKIILSPKDTLSSYIQEREQLEMKLKKATDSLSLFLDGDNTVDLINIATLTERLKRINTAFPSDMKAALLQAAMQGKLTEQLPEDGNAKTLLEQIQEEKARLIKEKKIKKEKILAPISEDQVPFEIPENWKWCYLGDVFNHVAGKALNSRNTTGSKHKYITTSNVYWDHFELNNLKEMYYTDEEVEKYSVKKGDLLVLEGGDVGRTAIWNLVESYCVQNHIHRLRPYIQVNVKYFYYSMMYFKLTGAISGKGIAIQGLSASALHSINIPLPPLAEQYRIVEKLDKLLPLCESLETNL